MDTKSKHKHHAGHSQEAHHHAHHGDEAAIGHTVVVTNSEKPFTDPVCGMKVTADPQKEIA